MLGTILSLVHAWSPAVPIELAYKGDIQKATKQLSRDDTIHRMIDELVEDKNGLICIAEFANKISPIVGVAANDDGMPSVHNKGTSWKSKSTKTPAVFDETKAFLRPVETSDRSMPMVVGPALESAAPPATSSAAPRAGARVVPLAPAPPVEAAEAFGGGGGGGGGGGSSGGGAAMDQLLQLVPMFDDTKQFLRKVETVDSSQPKLEAEGLSKQGGGSARQQLLQLVPMFDETKAFLRPVETSDRSMPMVVGPALESAAPPATSSAAPRAGAPGAPPAAPPPTGAPFAQLSHLARFAHLLSPCMFCSPSLTLHVLLTFCSQHGVHTHTGQCPLQQRSKKWNSLLRRRWHSSAFTDKRFLSGR